MYMLSFIQWYIKIFSFKKVYVKKNCFSLFVPSLVKYSCQNLILLAIQKKEEEGNQWVLSPYSMFSPFHTMSHFIFTYYDANIIFSVLELRCRLVKKLTQGILTSIFRARFAPVLFF